MRILITDDSKVMRNMLADVIVREDNNYEVYFASSGRSCVEKFIEAWEADKPFDIIFLDIEMPTSGTAALHNIRDIEKELRGLGEFDSPYLPGNPGNL